MTSITKTHGTMNRKGKCLLLHKNGPELHKVQRVRYLGPENG